MSMSVGASSSNAMSYLQQLLHQGKAKAGDASKTTDPLSMLMQSLSGGGSSGSQTGDATSTASSASAGPSVPPIGADAMRMLISVQGEETGNSAESKFFAKLDSDGDGSISQSEFSTAASNAGADSSVADAVFAKIDANGDGAISQDELAKADRGGHRHHHIGGGGGTGGLDALLSSVGANGATTQSATNADGSTTTTITYADGSKIDMTTPASVSSNSNSSNSSSGSGRSDFSKSASNMLEQLIKLQSQMLNAAASTLSAVA